MLPKYVKVDAKLFRQMAKLKANGASWDAVAEKVGKPAEELEDLTWRADKAWNKYWKHALNEALKEAMGESVHTLRSSLRSDKERHRIMASNSLVRVWNTQNPKARQVKQPKKEVLTERQKFYRRKADNLAAMTDYEVAMLCDKDARAIFNARLGVYLHRDPELLTFIRDVCDIDEKGQSKHTDGKDYCELAQEINYEHWRKNHPHLLNPQPKKEEPPKEQPSGMASTFHTMSIFWALICCLFLWGSTAKAVSTNEPEGGRYATVLVLNPNGVAFNRPGCEPRTLTPDERVNAEHLGFTPKAIKNHPVGVQQQPSDALLPRSRDAPIRGYPWVDRAHKQSFMSTLESRSRT
jgi:hypothetical protein